MCNACGGRVYQMERVSVSGAEYHERCCKCTVCGSRLTTATASSHYGSVYCATHARQAVANGISTVKPGSIRKAADCLWNDDCFLYFCKLVRDPHLLAKLKLLSKKFHQIIQGLCPKPPKLVDVKHVCDWSSLRDIPGQHVLVTWEKYSENCKVPHSFEILSWIWEKPWRGEPQIITKTLKKDRLMEYEAGIPYQVPLRDGNGGYLRDDYGDCIPDPETDPSGGNYSHLLFVTNTVTKICKLRVAAYNEYGWSVSSPTEITIGCFGGNTKVQMECGTKFLKDVQVGDKVTTGNGSEVTEVLAVQEMPCFKERWMTAAPGLSLTRGHPVMKDGEWYRADEIFETELVFQEKLYNLCLQTTHTIVIVAANGVQLRCATLGCVCPRLAARDTVSDQKYGSGYRPLVTKHVGCHKQAIK